MTGFTTTLELTSLKQLQPGKTRASGLSITRVIPPDGAVNRRFYEIIGPDFGWTHLDGMSDRRWQVRSESFETFVATFEQCDVGWYELERHAEGAIEIKLIGLLAAWRGRGLGAALLTHAVRTAFLDLGATRLWLETTTNDHAAALYNYRARGFDVVARVARP